MEELAPGTLLGGRYRVGPLLGSGGMGSVYEGVQEGLDRKVALKVLHKHLANEQELIERFKREARSIATLVHPNVVQISDFQTNPGEPPFIVMELLEGESLSALLRREPRLPGERVAFIAVQVLAALGEAHEHDIIHRDIKPDNIYISATSAQSDLVKVLDFGVAKVLRDAKDPKITRTGFVVGTLSYMSPEQAKGEPLDGRADLYSLGAVMYLALAGRKPFDAPTTPALVGQILKERPLPLAALREDVDTKLLAIVERALEKNRADRFPDAQAMAAALAPYAKPTSTKSPEPRTASIPVTSSVPTVREPSPKNSPSIPPTDRHGPEATRDGQPRRREVLIEEAPMSQAPEGQRTPRTPLPPPPPVGETTLRLDDGRKQTLPSNLAPIGVTMTESASLVPSPPAPAVGEATFVDPPRATTPTPAPMTPPAQSYEVAPKTNPLVWMAVLLLPLSIALLFGANYALRGLLEQTAATAPSSSADAQTLPEVESAPPILATATAPAPSASAATHPNKPHPLAAPHSAVLTASDSGSPARPRDAGVDAR